MSFKSKIGLFLLGICLASTVSAAKDPNEKLIKARQSEMQLRSFNVGPLFGMAKGKIEYDAQQAGKLAAELQTLLSLDMGRAWKKGTDNEAYSGKTTALPKIWNTYPKISEYGDKYKKAVNELAAVAGNGLDALKSKIGPLGKACKACHDDFREKK